MITTKVKLNVDKNNQPPENTVKPLRTSRCFPGLIRSPDVPTWCLLSAQSPTRSLTNSSLHPLLSFLYLHDSVTRLHQPTQRARNGGRRKKESEGASDRTGYTDPVKMGGACLLDTPPKSYIPSTHQLSVEHKLMSLSWWIPSLHLAHSHQLYQKCTQQNAFKLSDNCQWRQNEFLQKQHNSFQGRRFCFKIGRDILKSTKPMQKCFHLHNEIAC